MAFREAGRGCFVRGVAREPRLVRWIGVGKHQRRSYGILSESGNHFARPMAQQGDGLVRGSPVAGMTPAVLRWARESANMSVDEVARRLKKTADLVSAWEVGSDAPTYSQLETLAYDIYKRPLALFFLPAHPDESRPRAEFRSLPDADLANISRETTLLIRKARAFQLALIELHGDRNPVPAPIWRQIHLDPRRDAPRQAAGIRELLDVKVDDIRKLPSADAALKDWRRAIERNGVHVFKDTFKQSEFSGFSLWHPEFPVILINNSTTKTRQIFSLMHELAHVLCDRNGISRFDDEGIENLPPADRAIERSCNALAAEILVPMKDLIAASRNVSPQNATDEQFGALAVRFHVSRSVILRRFVERGMVTVDFYLAKDREWAEQRRKGEPGGNYYATQGTYISEQFLREVVSRYARRQLTKAEAADLLGVKPRNFDRFEDLVLRGAAA
jgi:Zn-dependent peptidase ImmA (M78 family)/DNA-binding transcriptional regulator YiaG